MLRKISFVVFLLTSLLVQAHGDLSIRIRQKTLEILENPEKSELYFERGFLYQQHEDFKLAMADYKMAEQLGFLESLLYYRKSETYKELKLYKKALKSVHTYIQQNPLDVKGRKLEAQVLIHLKDYKKAIKAYDFVIKNTTDLSPSDIIEYSEFFLKRKSKDYNAAIKAIDIGLEKLGKNVVTLRLKKMEYLKESKKYTRVLEEYDSLLSTAKRKEFLYFEKAVYLSKLHRDEEAMFALKLSEEAIGELHLKFQNTAAVKKLKFQINELKEKIDE